MKKVKIFLHENPFTMEDEINEFLEDKVLIDIKFNVIEGSYFTKYQALVIYEDWR